jgi:hypothetical protein
MDKQLSVNVTQYNDGTVVEVEVSSPDLKPVTVEDFAMALFSAFEIAKGKLPDAE